MTYALLAAGFLAAAIVAAVAIAPRPRSGSRRAAITACAAAAAALLVLTAVFDSVMIAAGLFTYADDRIIGARIGLAPLEDFAYPLAAVVLLPALWARLEHRRDR